MAQTALSALRTYADLTKPRLLPLVLFTGLPVLGMAAGGWPSLRFAALTLLGIALAAASANTLNAYLERVGTREPDILRRLREETQRMPEANMQIAVEEGALLALLSLSTFKLQ